MSPRGSDSVDHSLKDITVQAFLDTLRAAAEHLDGVQPESLREPLRLWFRATEEKVKRERWALLLGRPVVPVWSVARAVLGRPEA